MFGTTCQKIKMRNGPSCQHRRELEREKLMGAVHQEKSDNKIEKIFKQSSFSSQELHPRT